MAKLDADAVWEFAKAIRQTMPAESQKRQATVQSVDDDGTVWVQVAGSDDVTPIATSNANVQPGDVVNVEQRGASLHVEGNITDPSVGERGVERVVAPVRAGLSKAAGDADAAKLAAKAAQEAAEAASAANQHFWDDTNGAHVTEVEKDEWTDPTSPDYHSGHNMLLNSLGLLFRKAMNNLASFTQSAVAFFDGEGNEASNVVASFGADGFQAGKANESHLVGDYHSLRLVDKEGDTYFHVSDLRNEEGLAEITETFVGDGVNDSFGVSLYGSDMPDEVSVTVDGVAVSFQIVEWPDDILLASAPPAGSLVEITYQTDDERTKAYTLGKRKAGETMGGYSVAEGDEATASGVYSHAEGYDTAARGFYAHAEGWATASVNEAAHAEGVRTTASGTASHAEGRGTTASGHESHAEGQSTTASGTWSHSEGYGTTASGGYSHAEGSDCVASGTCSHAQNSGTIAASYGQTAIGKCNVADANGTYALIVGNGQNANARSNAHTLDWSGNADYAGEVTAHSGSTAHNLTDKADASDLADLAAEVADIGDNVSHDINTAVSSSTSTWTSVGSIDLTEGIWVVIAGLQFASNGTGYRYISLNNANGTPAAAWTRATRNSVPAISGNATVLHTSHIVTAGASGTTIHLMGWQNSGAQLNLTGRLNAVRIK